MDVCVGYVAGSVSISIVSMPRYLCTIYTYSGYKMLGVHADIAGKTIFELQYFVVCFDISIEIFKRRFAG